jgi:tetratricopeptide (TPR) repeat protein
MLSILQWGVAMKTAKHILAVVLLTIAVNFPTASQVVSFPGDEAFARMDYDAALKQYDSVLHAIPPHPELLWRLARLHIAMGDVAEKNDQMEHYRDAEASARQCTGLDTTNSAGYAWLAAALGSIAMDAGSRRKVELANEIKRCLDRAVALNPNNDIAWSILGTFYRSLGGVSWIERQLANLLLGSLPEGGYEESEEAFQRAIAIAPSTIRHRFELALLYEQTDRLDLAGAEYAQCLRLLPQMASDRKRKEDALKWLREHRNHANDMQ